MKEQMSTVRLERFMHGMRTADYFGEGWIHYAGCIGVKDPELFFPLAESAPYESQIREAKTHCGNCPVMMDCRRSALLRGEGAGIFGGMTFEERSALLRYAARNRVSREELVGV